MRLLTVGIIASLVGPGTLEAQVWRPDWETVDLMDLLFDRQAARSCTEETPVVTSDSVGPLPRSGGWSDLDRICDDVVLGGWSGSSDAAPEPAAGIRLGGVIAVMVFEAPTSPAVRQRTIIFGPFRTMAGIRWGDPAVALHDAYGEVRYFTQGELCGVVAQVNVDGRPLAFRLRPAAGVRWNCEIARAWRASGADRLPGQFTVRWAIL